jgi:predicted GNAT family N-acyltransferase
MVVSLAKAKAWIKAHWNWLVLVGLFCLAYVLGKKSSGTLLAQATIAKDQYKKESQEIERVAREKNNRDKKNTNRTKEIIKKIEEKKEKDLSRLETDIDADQVFRNLGIDER